MEYFKEEFVTEYLKSVGDKTVGKVEIEEAYKAGFAKAESILLKEIQNV